MAPRRQQRQWKLVKHWWFHPNTNWLQWALCTQFNSANEVPLQCRTHLHVHFVLFAKSRCVLLYCTRSSAVCCCVLHQNVLISLPLYKNTQQRCFGNVRRVGEICRFSEAHYCRCTTQCQTGVMPLADYCRRTTATVSTLFFNSSVAGCRSCTAAEALNWPMNGHWPPPPHWPMWMVMAMWMWMWIEWVCMFVQWAINHYFSIVSHNN